jgi:hypothetical protein
MVFFPVVVVDGKAEFARQRLEGREGAVALLGVGGGEQRVDRGIGAAVARGVEERGERAGALIAFGRKMEVAFARLLAVSDDQDELRQAGLLVSMATLCHVPDRAPTRAAATQPMLLRGRSSDGCRMQFPIPAGVERQQNAC